MHCTACGTSLGDGWRCPHCKRFAHGLSLNLYSVAQIVSLLIANWIHHRYLFPLLLNLARSMGLELNLVYLIYLGVESFVRQFFFLVIPILAAFLILAWKKKWFRSGRLLAIAAWLLLLYTLAGLLSGYVFGLVISSMEK